MLRSIFLRYRCTHKTKSQLISMLHLTSIYGTHPELRQWLHATPSAVLVKHAQYLDKIQVACLLTYLLTY